MVMPAVLIKNNLLISKGYLIVRCIDLQLLIRIMSEFTQNLNFSDNFC
jgi:hypothetical protein